MKETHKLFFAIPFDTATKKLYERISDEVRKRFEGVVTVIGSSHVGPSPEYSEIESFRAQNRELTRQFVAEIASSDIVIADLTHNNPNVHVELGIALVQNKNILRVTGRSVSELGFDIRSLEVFAYGDEECLKEKIISYLDIFFKIKRLPISKDWAPLYCESLNLPIALKGKEKDYEDVTPICPDVRVRDGAVKVEFEILDARKPRDWFGIYFRAGDFKELGSHLVYVRHDGRIEIAVFPGPRVISKSSELHGENLLTGNHSILVEFENNQVDVIVDDVKLQTTKLSHQKPGSILLAGYYADVSVKSAEMICRDTLEWDALPWS